MQNVELLWIAKQIHYNWNKNQFKFHSALRTPHSALYL